MLDAVTIFTKGGLVLFSWSIGQTALKGNPVDALIRTQLLEERGGAPPFPSVSQRTRSEERSALRSSRLTIDPAPTASPRPDFRRRNRVRAQQR